MIDVLSSPKSKRWCTYSYARGTVVTQRFSDNRFVHLLDTLVVAWGIAGAVLNELRDLLGARCRINPLVCFLPNSDGDYRGRRR